MLVSLLRGRQRQADSGYWEGLPWVGWSVCRFQDNGETLFYFMGEKERKKEKKKAIQCVCGIVTEVFFWLPLAHKFIHTHIHIAWTLILHT